MKDSECIDFLQWALPRLHRPWRGFRKVRGQVCKRVDRRLRELGLSDAHAYRAYLASHPHEWPILDALCPITISVFYRDTAVFDAVAASVLPELACAARARSQKNLRALCVGCACGEEPYTLALAWHFAVAPAFPGTELHIIATDVLEEVLARARDGCYAAGSLKLLPAAWRTGAFERKNDVRCLKPEFRERIEFMRQDVRAGLPAGPFDLMPCAAGESDAHFAPLSLRDSARYVMLPDNMHGARLRAKLARFFDETNFPADLKITEACLDHAVLVKIHESPVRRFDPAVVGIKLGDAPMRHDGVCLHGATPAARMVFKPAPHRVERVANRHMNVLVRVMLRRLAAHDDFISRHLHVDAHVIEIALMVMPMMFLDDDATADDAVEEFIEFVRTLAHFRLDRGGRLYVAKNNL